MCLVGVGGRGGGLRTQIKGHGALRPGLEGHVRWL